MSDLRFDCVIGCGQQLTVDWLGTPPGYTPENDDYLEARHRYIGEQVLRAHIDHLGACALMPAPTPTTTRN